MSALPAAVDIRVQTDDFCVGEELQALRTRAGGALGAVASFVGLVRDGLPPATVDTPTVTAVSGMYLEHYPGMTEKSIAAIIAKATHRWGLLDVVVIHRVGELLPSDQIVFVQVASAHREAAFAACEMIMDYLKTDAVFWKKERSEDQSRWVQSSDHDHNRAAAWHKKKS